MTEPKSALGGALLLACALACDAAWAQLASQASAAASAAERAQRETDRTMYWIRILAVKPAPAKSAAAPAPRPAAVATAPASRPAAEVREKVKVAAATPPAATGPTSDAATAAAAPMVIAPAPALTQPSVNDAPYPSALSSSSADHAATAVGGAATPPAPEPAPAPATEPDPGLVQVKAVQPEFPQSVVLRVHKGNVEVRFEVDPAGTVVDATVVQSSNARLNNAAVDAVRQWRFKPTPTGHTAAVNLIFDIDKEP